MADELSEEGNVELFFEFPGQFGDEVQFDVAIPHSLFLGVGFEVGSDLGGESGGHFVLLQIPTL